MGQYNKEQALDLLHPTLLFSVQSFWKIKLYSYLYIQVLKTIVVILTVFTNQEVMFIQL